MVGRRPDAIKLRRQDGLLRYVGEALRRTSRLAK